MNRRAPGLRAVRGGWQPEAVDPGNMLPDLTSRFCVAGFKLGSLVGGAFDLRVVRSSDGAQG